MWCISVVQIASFFLAVNPAVYNKFFDPANGTVSKFPPIIEYIVQRIQQQNSNYVHEDLSRPQTWDKPTYTLSPSEQLTQYQTVPQHTTEAFKPPVVEAVVVESTTRDLVGLEYADVADTTEKLFEIITDEFQVLKSNSENGTTVTTTEDPIETTTTPSANNE